MDTFLQLPDDRKKLAYEQVSQQMGIPASYVEKDFWVCWVLQVLFSHADLAGHLSFRGGTSLSKAFGIIERFSEDIDLSVSRSWLGITDANDPGTASNNSQRERLQKGLRGLARERVTNTIEPCLREMLEQLNMAEGAWSLELSDETIALENARDPYCLFLNYPCLTGVQQTDYIRSRVKIELSAKAEGTPGETVQLTSFVAEKYPDVFTNTSFLVKVVSPTRTFFEKLFIIHEENTAPASRAQMSRLARHYYDLHCLAQSESVVWDAVLFEEVKNHRKVHFRRSWVDYQTITPQELQIEPQNAVMQSQWETDYGLMESMIYGDYPTLETAIGTIKNFINTSNV